MKFQNFLSVTRSVPCSPVFTVFFKTPPGSMLQLLCPFSRRKCQPLVSLPLNSGTNPASSNANGLTSDENPITSKVSFVFIVLRFLRCLLFDHFSNPSAHLMPPRMCC